MKIYAALKKIIDRHFRFFFISSVSIATIFLLIFIYLAKEISLTKYQIASSKSNAKNLEKKLSASQKELEKLKNEDQYKRNEKLQEDIKNIERTYSKTISSYEKLLDIKTKSKNTTKFDNLFAESISYLSKRNYSSGEATLNNLNTLIDDENAKTLVSAHSREVSGKNMKERASLIGKVIATKAKAKKINQVVFDRGGFMYIGNIKLLAEEARKQGLKF